MVILDEPCAIKEHENLGYSRPVFDLDKDLIPIPKPENGDRVLFFGCLGCDNDRYSELMPNCPKDHSPYRYFSALYIGCHQCDSFVQIKSLPKRNKQSASLF